MSTDKTLADVQPGGRVRLGDATPSVWRTYFNAWAHTQGCRLDGDGEKYYSQGTQGRWEAWQAALVSSAALSAQPSPGGQGDALELLERYDWAVSALDAELNEGWDEGGRRARLQSDRDEVRAELIAALVARQPVGEPVVYGLRVKGTSAIVGVLPVELKDFPVKNAAWDERYDEVPLYAAPPAHRRTA